MIAKGVAFRPLEHLETYGNEVFGRLVGNRWLRNQNREQFVQGLIDLVPDLNAFTLLGRRPAHPSGVLYPTRRERKPGAALGWYRPGREHRGLPSGARRGQHRLCAPCSTDQSLDSSLRGPRATEGLIRYPRIVWESARIVRLHVHDVVRDLGEAGGSHGRACNLTAAAPNSCSPSPGSTTGPVPARLGPSFPWTNRYP